MLQLHLGADPHGPLLLGVVVRVPPLLLAAIDNLKVHVIIHSSLGLNGGASAVRKGCRVVRQEEGLLRQMRSLPNMVLSTTIHVSSCLR